MQHTPEKKSFKTWIKDLKDEKSKVGHLAGDICFDDENFPDGGFVEVRSYLESCGACDGAMEAFDEAWKRYRFDVWVK